MRLFMAWNWIWGRLKKYISWSGAVKVTSSVLLEPIGFCLGFSQNKPQALEFFLPTQNREENYQATASSQLTPFYVPEQTLS